MTVQEKLAEFARAITQERLAEAMGVSVFYLRQLLRGQYQVGERYIYNLAEVYPIDPEAFLDESADFTMPKRKRKHVRAECKPDKSKITKRCKACDYCDLHLLTCDYLLLTGHSRNCKPGNECDKYKPRGKRRRPKYMNYGGEDYDL